ncbi:MAG TPA: TOMM precursor leader peptide-binding protein [Pseudonocardia sp.]|nr:TOMM precursor leader peptide-binding protein [Pseudonocardia sp.]
MHLPEVLRFPPHRTVLPCGRRSRLVGLDPARAAAVDDLEPPLAAMLDELAAAPVETAALLGRAAVRGADVARAAALLGLLVDAQILVDAHDVDRGVTRRREAAVVVVGDGPLAVGIATGLAAAGVGRVHVEAAGAVAATDLGTGYLDADVGLPRATAAAAAVRRVAPTTGTRPSRNTDLVVLADALVPEPGRVARLLAERVAHLAVRTRDGVGVVGPLVLPGRSACLHCLDAHRGDRDPVWGLVAAQLVGRIGSADPAATAATAALGTAQALTALPGPDAEPPPVLDATLELDAGRGTILRRAWAPRAGCPCGAVRGGPTCRT